MPVYCCRWESGEVSFISARSKSDACFLLDEFAAAEPEDHREMKDFMLSFALRDDGGVVLSELGEATGKLFEKIYPVLYRAKQRSGAGIEEPINDGGPEIRAAVEKERTRLAGRMRKRQTKSPTARALQEQLGMSATVAERHVRVAKGGPRKRGLRSDGP